MRGVLTIRDVGPVVGVFFGSRGWRDLDPIAKDMEDLVILGDGALVVVTGAAGVNPARTDKPARSADALADWEARRRGYQPVREWAQWNTHDYEGTSGVRCWHRYRPDGERCPAAGVRRNLAIVNKHVVPSLEKGMQVRAYGYRLIGPSPGTDDMHKRLIKVGVEPQMRSPE